MKKCIYCSSQATQQLVGTGQGNGSRPNEQGLVFLIACDPCSSELGTMSNAVWKLLENE